MGVSRVESAFGQRQQQAITGQQQQLQLRRGL